MCGPSFADDDTPVASIGNQPILAGELDAAASAKLKKQKETYDAQLLELKLDYERTRQAYLEKELGDLIDARVLALEAKARKTTPAALTAAAKPPDPSIDQVHSFYESNKGQLNQPYDTLVPQIKSYLQKQANLAAQRSYLDSLRKKYQVVVSLPRLRETVAASGPQRGPAGASVTIIEFADFQCPYCGRYAPHLTAVLAKYPTQVRLIYRHLPLAELHPNAQKAAEAAVCAQNQGKFWEMHDLLFAEQASLGVAALKEKARRLGLDGDSFDACLDSGKAVAAVRVDVQAARDLGLGSTPASFVNGRFVGGDRSLEEMSSVIDEELQKGVAEARR
jgi:protein-disulfide isomerase